jgi:hypothetical protein
MTIFLTELEVATLSGRKRKSAQIDALRRMGVAFFVNGAGRPVVTRTAVDGRADAKPEFGRAEWVPRVVGVNRGNLMQ